MDQEEPKEHKSFGIISWSRVHSARGRKLFASLLHNPTETVCVRVNFASQDEDERVFPRRMIVEVEMSQMQFSGFISNPNADGAPCTIRWVEGGYVEPPPVKSKEERISSEFTKSVDEMNANIKVWTKEIEAILDKKSIGKKDRDAIRHNLGVINNHLQSNYRYYLKCFTEASTEIGNAIKADTKASIDRLIQELGFRSLDQIRQAFFSPAAELKAIPEEVDE